MRGKVKATLASERGAAYYGWVDKLADSGVTRSEVPLVIDGRHPLLKQGIEYHHIFPQELKPWITSKVPGFDIDRYTLPLTTDIHQAIHAGKEVYGAGGWWNNVITNALKGVDANKGILTQRDILAVGAQIRREFQLTHIKAVPYPK